MSRKDYIEIGGIMTRKNGKKYECIDGAGCIECAFCEKNFDYCGEIKCSQYDRKDGNYVHFIRRKDLESV